MEKTGIIFTIKHGDNAKCNIRQFAGINILFKNGMLS